MSSSRMKPLVPGSLPAAFGVDASYEWATRSFADNIATKSNCSNHSNSPRSSGVRSHPKTVQRPTPYSRFETTRSRSTTPVGIVASSSSSMNACSGTILWGGPAWGTVSFFNRPDNQQILNNWSYSENGPSSEDLMVRKLGDIHLSPADGVRTLRCWVCMDVRADKPGLVTRSWVLHLPGRPHPVYQDRVLQPARHGSCAPRWVLRRSFRPQ
ncbi:hypothetical protein FRC12_003288 [Ceratobasidium sp. 428]|nr:hypothetical protein FRC12_003288 [Ceratobasidium sp. 428]